MKQLVLAFVAASTVAVFLSGRGEAATGIPFEGRCTIVVDGKFYLSGEKCRVDFWANLAGPLTCGEKRPADGLAIKKGMAGDDGLGACVECDQVGTCEASWHPNGRFSRRLLGLVKATSKRNECWANKRALICFEDLKAAKP